MTYTENDILLAVGHKAFTAGKAYQRQGRVVAFQWEGHDGITAQVLGSERKPYRLSISIKADHKGRVTLGDCSCPVAFNCKHVAASLMHGLTWVTKPTSVPTPTASIPPKTAPRSSSGPAISAGSAGPAQAPLSLSGPVADWLNRLREADARIERGEVDLPQRLIYILSAERA